MSFTVKKVESKNSDWKVISLVNGAGDLVQNVSVNRTSKKGAVFPGFDNIQVDDVIEGQLWESDAGKTYLFPPREARSEKPAQKPDSGPAANSPATAEIKNILTLKVGKDLEKIRQMLVSVCQHLGIETDEPPF